MVLSNGLALNPNKTDAIIFGIHRRLQALDTISHIDVVAVQVQHSGEVKLLGVVLDKRLTLDSHVKAMSKAIYYNIRAFRHIRHALNLIQQIQWPVRYWDHALITPTRFSSALRQRTSPSYSAYRTLSSGLSCGRTVVRKPFQY